MKMMRKRFAAFLIGVGMLAAIPWAWAAGVGSNVKSPNPAMRDASSSPAADQRAVDAETGWRVNEKHDRWRAALVDPAARPTHYTEDPDFADLQPRQPLHSEPAEELDRMPADATGVLIVKFRDDARIRLSNDISLISRGNAQPGELRVLERRLQRMGLTLEPAFYRSEQQLSDLESRAAQQSGKMQPDLAGMMHLTGPEQALTRAAQFLAEHPLVEFVEFEIEMHTGQVTGACCIPTCSGCAQVTEVVCTQMMGTWNEGEECDVCGDPGSCCIIIEGFDDIFCEAADDAEECIAIGEASGGLGYFQGPGTVPCMVDDDLVFCEDFEPECGACGTGGCLQITDDRPFCELEACCEAVCEQDPFCCGELDPTDVHPGRGPQRWDAWCVQLARQFCGGDFAPPGTWPQCLGNVNPCTEPHEETGCAVASCCNAVCDANPTCCTVNWNAQCALLAENLCVGFEDPAETPNFTHLQGYLTPGGYADPPPVGLGGIPVPYSFIPTYTAGGITRPIPGYGGEGYDLEAFDGLGQFLLDTYGIGNNPDMPGKATTKGETIRIGIIEHTAFVQPFDPEINNHEALQHVISEPGQTVMVVPGSSNLTGHHGTASLGVAGGREFITGVAHEADMYFFPIVSVEEGGRLGRAMISAMEEFDAGDVLSFSIGPGAGCGTLASSPRNWMLLDMASDIGITCVISAGNSCCNLDDGPAQFGDADSDVIIVGAVYPGRDTWNPFLEDDQGGNVHCRLPFSNYCQECDQQGAVHVGAWGILVTTAGYGDLFVGAAEDTRLRSYTAYYNGTSAAAPQVAGVAARLQSFAKQFYGIPLTPEQIRNLIAGNGITQCGAPANRPDLVPGHVTPSACDGSWNQESEPDYIGTHPDGGTPIALTMLFPAGESLISSEFFGCSPFHQEVHTIHGEHVQGNLFSVCALDGNFYISRTKSTSPGASPSNPPAEWASQVSKAVYNVGGQVTDVLVVGNASNEPVLTMSVLVAGEAPIATTSIVFVQIYDWNAGFWVYAGSSLLSPFNEDDDDFPFFIFVTDPAFTLNPQRFVHDSHETILVRVWGFSFNAPADPGSPGEVNYQLRLDLVDLDIGADFVAPTN